MLPELLLAVDLQCSCLVALPPTPRSHPPRALKRAGQVRRRVSLESRAPSLSVDGRHLRLAHAQHHLSHQVPRQKAMALPAFPLPPPVTPVLRENSDFRLLEVKPLTPRGRDRFSRGSPRAEDRGGTRVARNAGVKEAGLERVPHPEDLCLNLERVIAKDRLVDRSVVQP